MTREKEGRECGVQDKKIAGGERSNSESELGLCGGVVLSR